MAWTSSTAPFRHVVGGSPVMLSEETANDSDKTLQPSVDIGANVSLLITCIRVEFTATATVGDREFSVILQDSSNDIISQINMNANTNVAASGSVTFELHPGEAYLAAIDGGPIKDYLPRDLWVGGDEKLRIADRNAVDAAADDMVVHIRAIKFSA